MGCGKKTLTGAAFRSRAEKLEVGVQTRYLKERKSAVQSSAPDEKMGILINYRRSMVRGGGERKGKKCGALCL